MLPEGSLCFQVPSLVYQGRPSLLFKKLNNDSCPANREFVPPGANSHRLHFSNICCHGENQREQEHHKLINEGRRGSGWNGGVRGIGESR